MNVSPRTRGFTLLEVLVALVIVAFGMGALMATLTSAADSVSHLREKSFAEWIALNRLSELRLRSAAPAIGKTSGDTEFAGSRWRWNQEVRAFGVGGVVQIEVGVARADAAADRSSPQLAFATGFYGTLASGANAGPDWTGAAFIAQAQAAAQQQQQQQQPQQPPGGPGTQPAPRPSSPP